MVVDLFFSPHAFAATLFRTVGEQESGAPRGLYQFLKWVNSPSCWKKRKLATRLHIIYTSDASPIRFRKQQSNFHLASFSATLPPMPSFTSMAGSHSAVSWFCLAESPVHWCLTRSGGCRWRRAAPVLSACVPGRARGVSSVQEENTSVSPRAGSQPFINMYEAMLYIISSSNPCTRQPAAKEMMHNWFHLFYFLQSTVSQRSNIHRLHPMGCIMVNTQ